jgi:hypothetical protein
MLSRNRWSPITKCRSIRQRPNGIDEVQERKRMRGSAWPRVWNLGELHHGPRTADWLDEGGRRSARHGARNWPYRFGNLSLRGLSIACRPPSTEEVNCGWDLSTSWRAQSARYHRTDVGPVVSRCTGCRGCRPGRRRSFQRESYACILPTRRHVGMATWGRSSGSVSFQPLGCELFNTCPESGPCNTCPESGPCNTCPESGL